MSRHNVKTLRHSAIDTAPKTAYISLFKYASNDGQFRCPANENTLKKSTCGGGDAKTSAASSIRVRDTCGEKLKSHFNYSIQCLNEKCAYIGNTCFGIHPQGISRSRSIGRRPSEQLEDQPIHSYSRS